MADPEETKSEQPDPQPKSEDHTETPNDDNSGNDNAQSNDAAVSSFDAQTEFKKLSDRLDQIQAMIDAIGGEVVAPDVEDYR